MWRLTLRRSLALLGVLLGALAHGQVWEKTVAPGLTYRMEVDTQTPRQIHALRFSLKSGTVKAMPELGQGKVYSDDPTKGRESVSELARRAGAVAAINGDYFPYTGDPLGLMVRGGELISVPYPGRASLGWGEKVATTGIAQYQGTMTPDGQPAAPLRGVNMECGMNELVLNLPVAGNAVCRQANRVYVVLKLSGATVAPVTQLEAEVAYLLDGTESVPIQEGNAILAASGTQADLAKTLKPGQKVVFDIRVTGFDWSKVTQVVGGGPFLVRGGQIAVDADAEGFPASFSQRRHPRTAVGITADGDLWWVAIDGKQAISDGATLGETAAIMRRLGCVEAINLDGGGSTTLNVMGLTVNRPSDGVERTVANGVVWIPETKPLTEVAKIGIVAPPSLFVGDQLTLSAVRDSGEKLPNAEVLWNARGQGWIDQGGRLRAVEKGTVTVGLSARGQVVTVDIPILPRPREETKASRGGPKANRKKGG